MNADRQTRRYCLLGTNMQLCCSPAMADCFDARFRMFPASLEGAPEICFDFQAVRAPAEHAVAKPEGNARPFYEMPQGEACYFDETDELYISFGQGVRALYMPRFNRIVISTVECEPRNLFVASHLILTIVLVEVFRRRDWYSVHAAGFSKNGRAILMPGTSGVGKSTLSVALLRAQFDYLTDDMVFLARSPDGLVVRGLIEDVDVSEQTIRFFPELDVLMQSPKTDGFTKRQLRVDEVYGAMPIVESRPSAIVFPRISDKLESTITQIDGDEAFREIVPNVLLTEQNTCQRHFSILAELVRQVRCYRLETGRDFDRIPSLLEHILNPDQEPVCA